jgi:hypothetical protein
MLDQTTGGKAMSNYNEITGEPIQSRAFTKQGRENYDKIFKKKNHETTTQHIDPDDKRKGKATRRPAR